MIEHSAEYKKAIVADSRRQFVRAVFDLYDPDMIIEVVKANDESPYSLTEQITDRGAEESEQKISSLEPDRWLLDGTWEIEPDDPNERDGQVGWESDSISGTGGGFGSLYLYVEQEISGVELLQAMSFQFSEKEWNGYPVDFIVGVYSGSQLLYSKEVTGNEKTSLVVDGFTVNFPTKLRLTIKRWSQSGRRVRVIRFLAGLYEKWDTKIIKSVDIYTESTFSGLSIPYSSCTIEVYNENKRFDPYAPSSIFKSIEARQAMNVELGLMIEDGSTEWLPGGVYYQQSGGWTLKDLTVQWKLVDMIGMLVNRRFVVPDTLPATLEGWVKSFVSSMGVNFIDLYTVDSDVSGVSLTAKKEDVEGKFCGELLRYACMATNTWPRQDMDTGKLRVGKLERIEGNRITLDNMPSYATMEANDDIADITFSLDEGKITFPGTNTDSDVSLSVNNPFVHTVADAQKAVVSCLFEYGGKSFLVRSRGNPSSETGDIMSVDTQFSSKIAARLYKQQLKFENGVMRNVPSYLIQSPNDGVYTNKVVLTGSGTWNAPNNLDKIKVTVISGGTGGQGGGGGSWADTTNGLWFETAGSNPGSGGKIGIFEISATEGQSFSYNCGKGGVGGAGGAVQEDGISGNAGGTTTFGQLTSANGKIYQNGLMDIQTGNIYAAEGGIAGGLYGSGGIGGKAGENGYIEITYGNPPIHRIIKYPAAGESGQSGKDGCIILEW